MWYSSVQFMNTHSKSDKERAATLEILNAIADQSDITQRNLADRLGVALGLANAYLKRCVKKGFVKIKHAPANRYLYYLTPQGFSEKSRLTAQFLTYSFDFYRTASSQIFETLQDCQRFGAQSVIFVGLSELTEIASIRVIDLELKFIGTFDPSSNKQHFVERPVWRRMEDLPSADAYVLTALQPCKQLYEDLVKAHESNLIFIPEMVRPLTELQ